MQRRSLARQTRGFPHRKTRCREPHLPVDVRQRAGRGTVPGQTRDHGHKAVLLIVHGKPPDAVRRVRQTVQQHHRAARLSGRHQHKGAVGIGRKLSRPHQALAIIAV